MNKAKKPSKINPSIRLNIFSDAPQIRMSFTIRYNTNAASNEMGTSNRTVLRCTTSGYIIPATPRIKSKLKLLLPITFPKAASVFPFTAEMTLTTSSGAEVPKETTVNPIARFDIPNFLAA
jgi:hypothetical protein